MVLAPTDAVRTMLHGVRRARGPGCSGLTARKHSTCPPRDASRTCRWRVRQPGLDSGPDRRTLKNIADAPRQALLGTLYRGFQKKTQDFKNPDPL